MWSRAASGFDLALLFRQGLSNREESLNGHSHGLNKILNNVSFLVASTATTRLLSFRISTNSPNYATKHLSELFQMRNTYI